MIRQGNPCILHRRLYLRRHESTPARSRVPFCKYNRHVNVIVHNDPSVQFILSKCIRLHIVFHSTEQHRRSLRAELQIMFIVFPIFRIIADVFADLSQPVFIPDYFIPEPVLPSPIRNGVIAFYFHGHRPFELVYDYAQ